MARVPALDFRFRAYNGEEFPSSESVWLPRNGDRKKKGMIPKEEEMVNSLQRTLTVADFRFLFLSLFSHFLPLSCCFFLSHTQELCIFLIIQVASKFELVLQWRHAFGSQVTKKLQVQC